MSEKFTDLLKKLLVMEYFKTEDEADRLIKTYPNVIVNGIFSGNLRATAMALEFVENIKINDNK